VVKDVVSERGEAPMLIGVCSIEQEADGE